VHHGANSLNNVANLHVSMAVKTCQFFEVLLPAGAPKYGLVEDRTYFPGLSMAARAGAMSVFLKSSPLKRRGSPVALASA
jgi:hypothetical protein